MASVPLAFPECPVCDRRWSESKHRGCSSNGSVSIDPDTERVECGGCFASWGIWQSSFYCSCGHIFDAEDSEAAVSEVIRAASSLAAEMDRYAEDMRRIRSSSDRSFQEWLGDLAFRLGGATGFLLGEIARRMFGT